MSDLEWISVTVPPLELEGRVRLDSWLARHLVTVSRSKVQEMIEQGRVKLNGIKVLAGKDSVKEDDVISYALLDKRPSNLAPFKMPLDIVYEDDALLVVNKQAGLAVHPGAGETGPTLVHGLLSHVSSLGVPETTGDDDEEVVVDRPGIVHRLDKDTTGLLVIAKTNAAHAHLSKQFHDKTNFRQYVALLNGHMPEGEWVRESWLHRDPRDRTRFASIEMAEYHKKRDKEGKDLLGYRYARTLFKREAAFATLTLASIRLYTGRTHQIRVHAKDMGSPVFGDQSYGKEFLASEGLPEHAVGLLNNIKRQLLHAWILGFTHPDTGKWLQFEGKLPEDFSAVLAALKNVSE